MSKPLEEIKVDSKFMKEMDKFRGKPEGAESLVEASRDSIIYFAENMLGFKPFSWQVLFLRYIQRVIEGDEDVNNEVLALTSRQIGKSTSIAVAALWAAIFNKKPETVFNNTSVIIVSRGGTQAEKLLKEIKKWMRSGNRFMKATYLDEEGNPIFGDEFFTDLLDPKEDNNKTVITFLPGDDEVDHFFKGSLVGSTIKCYAPTASVLGESMSIGIVDEAGHGSVDGDFILDELHPTGDSTDAVWIYTSTPWNPSGWFYEFADPRGEFGSDKYIKRFMFTIDALKNEPSKHAKLQYNNVMKKVDRLRKSGNNDSVAKSYYCKFVKGELSLFDPENVRNMFDDSLKKLSSFKEPCDLGVDFGAGKESKTVVTISYLDKEGKVVRLYDKVYGKDDRSLIRDIEDLMKYFNVQRIVPEECPAGESYIQDMEDKGWNVERFIPKRSKVKTYYSFRRMLGDDLIRSYPDGDLQEEMMGLEVNTGKRQSNITPAPGISDDRIDSFLLSAFNFIQNEGTGNKAYSFSREDLDNELRGV